MNYFLIIIKKHKFIYILIISLVVTVLTINNILEFAERIINNHFLLVFSIIVFYFLAQLAIKEEIKRKDEKRKH